MEYEERIKCCYKRLLELGNKRKLGSNSDENIDNFFKIKDKIDELVDGVDFKNKNKCFAFVDELARDI